MDFEKKVQRSTNCAGALLNGHQFLHPFRMHIPIHIGAKPSQATAQLILLLLIGHYDGLHFLSPLNSMLHIHLPT